MSHAAWNALVPYLSLMRRVIAFDIAGFGRTPPLPRGTLPTIANLVDGLEASLRAMGIEVPVDIVGNSLGGTIALEAANRGIARSLVAISPAGLWKEHGALHVDYVFGGLRFMAKWFPALHESYSPRTVATGSGARGSDVRGKPAHAGERCRSCR